MTNPYAYVEAFKNAFDFNQLFSTQRRNFEALSAANQAMIEGAQAATRRQAEVVRENFEQWLVASRNALTSGSPEASFTKQAEVAKDIFENTVTNLREISEMITKSSFEAFDVLKKRTEESMEEIGTHKPATSSKRKSA